ncbi:MAG: hypothetical protein NHB15_21085 [Methanosarcina barkeri]|nr:hypothetical protein [Methanosarcina sp. ERenArc_MAG2]
MVKTNTIIPAWFTTFSTGLLFTFSLILLILTLEYPKWEINTRTTIAAMGIPLATIISYINRLQQQKND